MEAVQDMTAYFVDHVEQRKTHPTDDLISTLMQAKGPDGQPLSDQHVLGSLRLLLIAGIDTTWSAIGSSLWHLAKTPADRERLVKEPELMPTAIEELLRAYSPVTMAREVMKETVISGCPVKPGNMVLLSFPAAGLVNECTVPLYITICQSTLASVSSSPARRDRCEPQ